MADVESTGNAARFQAITRANVGRTPQWARLHPELREAINVVSTVLPFRSNSYVMNELIDWDRVPNDPMYQLTFPQRGMLRRDHYAEMAALVRAGAPAEEIERKANRIRQELNPHPAGQMTHNIPKLNGEPIPGLQHKYQETVLFFPSQGQTCHAYCTFCFRWAQLVGRRELRFSGQNLDLVVAYLKEHPEVSDLLITGGDPMIMTTKLLRRYVEPLLDPALQHVQNIRIGTKAVAYWPQRFVTDDDADDLLRLFEQVVKAGRHLALMGHYSHPAELSTAVAAQAVRRIRSSGAVVRMQGPVVHHVNDRAETWADLWRAGVRFGAVPYYMFVARDTGARQHFELPLVRTWKVFRAAYRQVSGLARSVRGPCMSAFLGKVRIVGVTKIADEKVFTLEYLQARNPDLVRRPFFARYDAAATWFDQLHPVSDNDRAFFPEGQVEPYSTAPLSAQSRIAG